jgi:hypothetical protein
MIVCALAAASANAQQPSPDGWVVLPVEEYRALLTRANPESPPPALPPVDATLTRIDYDLRLDPSTSPGASGDAIVGRALLTVDVLRDGWVKVPVPAGLLVRDARVDGQPLPLIEGPPAHVVLSRAGRVVLQLDIVVPLTAAGGSESMTLPASAAPVSRATMTLPRGGVELAVNGGFVSERSESAGETRWTALGRAHQPLAFSWKRRVDDRRDQQPLRFRAGVTSVVGLGEEVSTIAATVRVDVQQGVAREIAIAIPAGVVINQVSGPLVADWTTSAGQLHVRFMDPVIDGVSFELQAESRLPASGELAVPLVRVPAAERESGGVAISVLGAGEIEKHHGRGLEPADVSDLAAAIAGRESPSMVAFRLRPAGGSDPRTLTVSVTRYTPQAVLVANIEEARYRTLAAEDGMLLVEGRYAVRNNQRSFLKITLPSGATLWSASVAGKAVRPGVAEADSVLIALEKGRAGQDAPTFAVRVTYLQKLDSWTEKGTAQLTLPALDLPVSRTGVEFYYSPRFRVALQPGAFRIESDPGVFAEALRVVSGTAAAGTGAGMRGGSEAAASPAPAGLQAPHLVLPERESQVRQLIDRYRNEGGGRAIAGTLPVDVTFPTIGPSLFMAAELTAESAAPAIDLAIRRIR